MILNKFGNIKQSSLGVYFFQPLVFGHTEISHIYLTRIIYSQTYQEVNQDNTTSQNDQTRNTR